MSQTKGEEMEFIEHSRSMTPVWQAKDAFPRETALKLRPKGWGSSQENEKKGQGSK